MKRLLPTILITICHATLTWLLFMLSFRMSMSRFDSGIPGMPGEHTLSKAAEIMMWPLITPILHWHPKWFYQVFPGLLGYIPLLLNSLLWALVIVWLWRRFAGTSRPPDHQLKGNSSDRSA
ncbi:MAG: hypothetical protein IPQ16_12540 [Geobacteraceae bacterium]|nr:hypothetical protein [Geobacteraceae bacterium]